MSMVKFCLLNGSCEELSRCLTITGRSTIMPLGKWTGSVMIVSIIGSGKEVGWGGEGRRRRGGEEGHNSCINKSQQLTNLIGQLIDGYKYRCYGDRFQYFLLHFCFFAEHRLFSYSSSFPSFLFPFSPFPLYMYTHAATYIHYIHKL